jgi:hypothetical protein
MRFTTKILPSLLLGLSSLTVSLLLIKQPSQAQSVRGSFIVNTLSGKCIDVDGIPGTNNTARLQLFDCEYSGRDPFQGKATDQRWELTSGGFIRNTLSGKCIDVDGIPGTNNTARLQLFDCEYSGRDPFQGKATDQRWRLVK